MASVLQNRFTQLLTVAAVTTAVVGPLAATASDEVECESTLGAIEVSSVIVPDGEICTLDGTEVQGDVTVKSGATLVTLGASVEGSIQGESAESVTLDTGTDIQGNVQLQQGNSVTITETDINGELQLQDNLGPIAITDNLIGGNLQAKNNDGGIEISFNTIGNNLQCQDNDPSPTGGNNTAAQKQGQCESL